MVVMRIRQPLHFDGLSRSALLHRAHAGTELAYMSYVTVETSVVGEMEECSLSVVFFCRVLRVQQPHISFTLGSAHLI